MSCLGVHFALTAEDLSALEALDDEQDRLDFLQCDLEERYLLEPKTWAAESDKAWDAMQRAFTDGSPDAGPDGFPLSHVIIGGRPLYSDDDYVMTLKTPEEVRAISTALEGITREDFRQRYDRIDPQEYGQELDDSDFDYTWHWFENVRGLYRRAATAGRAVLFTVDQ